MIALCRNTYWTSPEDESSMFTHTMQLIKHLELNKSYSTNTFDNLSIEDEAQGMKYWCELIIQANKELSVISNAVFWAKLLQIIPQWVDCYTS